MASKAAPPKDAHANAVGRASPARVALVAAPTFGYGRELMMGVRSYILERGGWLVHTCQPEVQFFKAVAGWNPDGIIAYLSSERLAKAVLALRKPVVNVSGALDLPGVARVGTDDVAVGRTAAQHGLERGFRHFGYISHGSRRVRWEQERFEGFRTALKEAGQACHSFGAGHRPIPNLFLMRWSELQGRVRDWIRRLPKPVLILACNDDLACLVSEICRHAHIAVPEEAALVGVDNDEYLCKMAYPPLSSVRTQGERIGVEAASLLDRLMGGASVPPAPVLLPPLGVVTRQSSDGTALEDAELAEAVRFIREHADRPIGVRNILQNVPVARRWLERKFRAHLGRTIYHEICRAHLERAKVLLSDTDLPMPSVASRSGFRNAARLCLVFRRLTGLTPTEYRRQFHWP